MVDANSHFPEQEDASKSPALSFKFQIKASQSNPKAILNTLKRLDCVLNANEEADSVFSVLLDSNSYSSDEVVVTNTLKNIGYAIEVLP